MSTIINANIMETATDFLTEKGIKQGLTQAQHCGIVTRTVIEFLESNGIGEMTIEQKGGLYQSLYPGLNASALRQKLEKAGKLTATPTSGGKVIDPNAFL